jgi:hypothetical protein
MAVVASSFLAGCGIQDEFNDDRGTGDAPTGDKDDSPAAVINMPNNFANVAHKCDGHGHRVYVSTHTAQAKQIAVIDDPSCG